MPNPARGQWATVAEIVRALELFPPKDTGVIKDLAARLDQYKAAFELAQLTDDDIRAALAGSGAGQA